MTLVTALDLFATFVTVGVVAPTVKNLHQEEDRLLVAGIVIFVSALTWVLLRMWRLV